MSSTRIEARDFRDAMGGFATGVCVVGAARADGAAIGMTVNSFSSVSLEPPLVLVCLGTESQRSQEIIAAKRFSISILSAHQRGISNHFAKPGEGLAPESGWRAGTNGAPLIEGACALVECDLHAQHMAGDHVVVIGQVTALEADPGREPLLYFRGGYRSLGGESA